MPSNKDVGAAHLTIPRDLFDDLKRMQQTLEMQFGFQPTMPQVLRWLLSKATAPSEPE